MKIVPEDEKKIVIADYAKGMTVTQLHKKYNFAKSAIYRWIDENELRDVQTITHMTKADFRKMVFELERLKLDNEIFMNCGCSRYDSSANRLATIERLKEQYNIHALCRVLDINRATFYNYYLRRKKETSYQKVDNELKPVIKEIFDKSKERFGSGKIKVKLNELGYQISTQHIVRLMRDMNLVCKQKRLRCFNTTNRKYMFRKNKVMQNFTQSEPNLVWVSDVTYARINQDFYAICVVIDLFSRKVLSYKISPNNDTKLILETFKEAFTIRNKPQNLTFHSDQGTQYAAYKFRIYLRDNGVKQSFSNPGTLYDNAVAESFFSIMKREELSHNYYHSLKELNETVLDFINYFNDDRPHGKLHNVSPNEFERKYFENKKL